MSITSLFRTEPSVRRPVFIFTALLAIVLIGNRMLEAAFDNVRQGTGDFPVWLPELGTIGEPITYYLLLFDFLKFIVLPATLVCIAYVYGQHRSVQSGETS